MHRFQKRANAVEAIVITHRLRAPSWARLVAVFALCPALLVGGSAAAAPAVQPSSTRSSTTAPSTTTPTTTPSTTAPTTAPSTTPPRTTSPTTVAPGVPAVPTGGSSATAPATPSATAPDPSGIIGQVQADLDQLQAIDQVAQSRVAASAAQTAADDAAAHVVDAEGTRAGAAAGVSAAQARVQEASNKLSSLAVAAYTGAAYTSPAEAPTGDPGQVKGADAFGLTGQLRQDAEELMGLITDQEQLNLSSARKQAARAQAVLTRAGTTVAQAQAALAAANQQALAAKQTATETLRSATVTGAAAAQQTGTGPTTTGGPPGASTTAASGAAAGPASASSTGAAPDGAAASAAAGDEGSSPRILGPPTVTAAEMAGWFLSTHHSADATVPITQLAVDYLAAGKVTGVRGDLAFAQSIVETGYFSFPSGGQLTAGDNNFAGIGACDSCSQGWSFPSAIVGVTAQEELLEAYASPTQVPTPLVGSVGVGGCCQTWTALAGKWATDPEYGISILTVYKHMLDYAIPEQLVAAGLAEPGTAPPLPAVPAAATGPTLPAILPAAGPVTTAPPKAPTLAPLNP